MTELQQTACSQTSQSPDPTLLVILEPEPPSPGHQPQSLQLRNPWIPNSGHWEMLSNVWNGKLWPCKRKLIILLQQRGLCNHSLDIFLPRKWSQGKSERSHPSASESESKRKLLSNCTTYDQAFVEKSEELLNARCKISLSWWAQNHLYHTKLKELKKT